MAGMKPILPTESVQLVRDTGTLTAESISVTATTYQGVDGASFTINIPVSLSSHGTLNIQGNNANPFIVHDDRRKIRIPNGSFTATWATVDTMTDGMLMKSVSSVPIRYVRLNGLGLTAANFVAYLWADSHVVHPF